MRQNIAVITGAGSGFGLATAGSLAARGYHVAMLDRDEPRLTQAASAVGLAHGTDVMARRVDVASIEDLDAAAAAVGAVHGHCDLLWANVGVQHFGAVETISDDVWKWVLDVNVIGAVRTVRAFLPLLRAAGGGRIVFTASANALAPAARLGVYQASKYALLGVAETLRIELADEGIEVSVVFPSGMITRHLESSAAARPSHLGSGAVDDADLLAMMASRPMTEADLTTAEIAAANAVEGVLAGEPVVITHGALDDAVAVQQDRVRAALARVAGRTA